ncbi:TetR/AcrR family transcriptional regulator [Haloarchaeobius sp. DYHT-AS-18]|uniref:TetR/AcrR family transcriptional regulator n=1 Tax=Haloarchaeobius sp. DYHT-AS-18 TaxID=3446117 RepID=UPI003EBFD2B6
MSGGFSEVERERIRERLVEEGRDLFSHYGLKKTTIADLTEPVGIATSTFYQFFDSKEALYVEILEREGERLMPQVMAPLEEHDDPEAAIVAFLEGIMDVIETNDLIRQVIFEPDEAARLRAQFSDKEAAARREEKLAYLMPYVEAWYEAGKVQGPAPDIVANAIRSVTLLSLHQEELDPARYDETRDLVIRAVAKGLTA